MSHPTRTLPPRRRARATSWTIRLLPLAIVGCLSATDAPVKRYFRPVVSTAGFGGAPSGRPIVVEPVAVAGHLGVDICWQVDGIEYGFYADRSWVEPPARMVERAIARELFLRRGFVRGSRGTAGSVTVDVTAFEEVRSPGHDALVRFVVAYRDGLDAERSHVIEARAPVADDEGETFARAMGAALAQAVAELADWIGEPR